jgi:hypothetical protein
MKRLAALAVCALVLGASVVAFNLLYLRVPDGMAPLHGFAPGIAAAYGRWLPAAASGGALTPAAFSRASALLQAAMWGAFIAAALIAARLPDGAAARAAFRLVAAAGAAIAVALLLTPPALSRDLYHYALFGRMIITRGLNPYVTPGDALAGDLLWPLASWHDFTTHYGPVFTGLSVVAAWIGGGGAVGTALAFKALATAGGAVAAWSAVALARREARGGLLPLVLVAWNPLALIETAGNGHNEMVMIALALAGVLLVDRGRPNFGFALLVASIHVKWITAGLAGLVVIAHLHELDGARARARALLTFAAIAAGLTIALYLPFWAGSGSVSSIRRLLLAGRGASGPTAASPAALVPFAAVVVVAIAVVARTGRRWLLEMAAAVSLAFVTFMFPWVFPWYLLPAAALLAVGPLSRLNGGLTVVVTGASMFVMAFWAILIPGTP